ncbi:alpha/beta hydrolase family protein [Acidovorax delafieldii]|uniref:alpha/beta hydrolase family protein n=1 Tax=Acidovorax delafieldii TaxID=47920 RepID=UPI003ECD6DA2
MKNNHFSGGYRHLTMACLTGALVACATTFGATGVCAQESHPSVPNVAPPISEALEVDAALFTVQSLDWFDVQRQRQVPAKLYLPAAEAAAGSLPLVVFSHGIGGSRDGYSYLGRYFAAHGYGSLHVQHVGSDRQLWLGNLFTLPARLSNAAQDSEAVNRVQDLRYALDKLLASQEGALFDTRRIAAAGHSYGANTTMLMAGAQVEQQGQKMSLRDSRITAAILLSAPPFYGMGDPGKILAGIDVPTLHITATDDVIQIPGYVSGLQDRLDIFKAMGSKRAAPKVLAVFRDGSHSIFTDRAGTGGLNLNPRVKVATRQLALAFLNGIPASNYMAVDEWSLSHADLVAAFEKRVP